MSQLDLAGLEFESDTTFVAFGMSENIELFVTTKLAPRRETAARDG